VAVEGDQVVLTPVGDSRLSLEERLAAFDPKRHGGERMATPEALGAECRSHPFGALSNASFLQVCERLNRIIQVGRSARGV
jgi:hypothetical protein